MKEFSYIDPITQEKVVLGYLDVTTIRGMMASSARSCVVLLQIGNNGVQLALQVPLNEFKGCLDRAKAGHIVAEPVKKKDTSPIITS